MPVRSIAQLKEWFRKGCYPKEEHFADLIDSYFHKEEGVIDISRIDELGDRLNGKYPATSGTELERRLGVLSADFDTYRNETDIQLDNIADNLSDIEDLDERQQKEIGVLQADLIGARSDISEMREKLGDINSLLDEINGEAGTVTPIAYVKVGDVVREFGYLYYTPLDGNDTVIVGLTEPTSDTTTVMGPTLALWITDSSAGNRVLVAVNEETYDCYDPLAYGDYHVDITGNTISINANAGGVPVEVRVQGIPFVELKDEATTYGRLSSRILNR